jgi:hypothetical protein
VRAGSTAMAGTLYLVGSWRPDNPLDGKPGAAACSPTLDHVTTASGGHARTEAVLAQARDALGLPGALQGGAAPFSCAGSIEVGLRKRQRGGGWCSARAVWTLAAVRRGLRSRNCENCSGDSPMASNVPDGSIAIRDWRIGRRAAELIWNNHRDKRSGGRRARPPR